MRGHGWTVFGVASGTRRRVRAAGDRRRDHFVWLPESARERHLSSLVGNTLIAPFVAAAWTLMYFRPARRRADDARAVDAAARA